MDCSAQRGEPFANSMVVESMKHAYLWNGHVAV